MIINKYLDQNSNRIPDIALLGIGFHAHDTTSSAGEGRLEVLADLLNLGGNVFSAEEVIKQLVIDRSKSDHFVSKKLTHLTDLSQNDPVSNLKGMQEFILTRGLRRGDTQRLILALKDPDRLRNTLLRNAYLKEKMLDSLRKNNPDAHDSTLSTLPLAQVIDELRKLKVTGPIGYKKVKERVFDELKKLGPDYLATYGKGELPKK